MRSLRIQLGYVIFLLLSSPAFGHLADEQIEAVGVPESAIIFSADAKITFPNSFIPVEGKFVLIEPSLLGLGSIAKARKVVFIQHAEDGHWFRRELPETVERELRSLILRRRAVKVNTEHGDVNGILVALDVAVVKKERVVHPKPNFDRISAAPMFFVDEPTLLVKSVTFERTVHPDLGDLVVENIAETVPVTPLRSRGIASRCWVAAKRLASRLSQP